MVNPIIEFIKQKGGWLFQKRVTLTNHDYPYYDYYQYENTEEEGSVDVHYVCGQENVNKDGDQHKYFVSKRMLIWCEDAGTVIRLNHNNNAAITLKYSIWLDTWDLMFYAIELHTNIADIYATVAALDTIHIYCEGVLPEETRDAE